MADVSIREWIQNFNEGVYDRGDIDTQCEAGWYDWFCKDSSLLNKTQTLGKKLKMIANSNKINLDKNYVFFKNNCPMNGSLYDDFRICDIKTGDVLYTITPRSGHKSMEGKGEVWGKENDFNRALFTGSWTEIKKWFLED